MDLNDVQIESIAGYVGGAIGIATTHPLDTVRIQLQSLSAKSDAKANFRNIVRNILNESGPLGFYKGLLPPVVLRGGTMCINRAVYELCDTTYTGTNPWLRSLLVGAVAGAMSAVVETPIHLLKTRAQMGQTDGAKESLWGYVKLSAEICKTEGPFQLYQGWKPNVIIGGVSYGIFYLLYDEMLIQQYSAFTAGVVSALISWPVAYPFDVIRTRLQTTPMKTQWSRDYWTFTRTTNKLFAKEFISEYFPGLGITMARAAPRWGIVMYVHENTRSYLRHNFSKD